MLYLIMLPLYIVMMGVAFTFLGEKYSPKNYWETPGPFMGCFLWPVLLLCLLGASAASLFITTGVKSEKKKDEEIKEAKHRLELAKIQASITAELEKSLL